MTADDDDRKVRLENTVNAIRARHGQRAIRHLRPHKPPIPHIPTGFAELDAALGIGGLPRGHVVELVSVPTSGMATLALRVVGRAQADGLAVYLDLDQSFDPPYAARCGVDLAQLLLIEPHDWRDACAILRDFVLDGHASILVFDTPAHLLRAPRPARQLAHTLDRLAAPLRKTQCTLLFLITLPPVSRKPYSVSRKPSPEPAPDGLRTTDNGLRTTNDGLRITDDGLRTPDQAPHAALAHHAAVRLVVYRVRWLYARRDIRGYEARVYIAKNRLAAAAGPVQVTLAVAGEGDAAP